TGVTGSTTADPPTTATTSHPSKQSPLPTLTTRPRHQSESQTRKSPDTPGRFRDAAHRRNVDGRGPPWNPPTPPTPTPRQREPHPATRSAPRPTCHPWPTGHNATTPFARQGNPPVDHATETRCAAANRSPPPPLDDPASAHHDRVARSGSRGSNRAHRSSVNTRRSAITTNANVPHPAHRIHQTHPRRARRGPMNHRFVHDLTT
ncbi:MAG: hypothetical protein QG671_954, partial [Actinomycetota bacterium]|nr:hypothetical protein [Actinomycetota bacterium]